MCVCVCVCESVCINVGVSLSLGFAGIIMWVVLIHQSMLA